MSGPAKYRHARTVSAVQWTGTNCAEIDAFIDDDEESDENCPIHLEVSGGNGLVEVGDWVVRDEWGGLEAVSAAYFAAEYAAVSA